MIDKKHSTAILAAILAVLVVAVYWQTTGFELINLDDPEYTVLNPVVVKGLTLSCIKEALTSIQLNAYMPVTLISYMTDIEIFGPKPFGFHFTNFLLHLLNSLLLFAFLYKATGSPWKSFLVAALWAVHPLRAESVAWVAERKDVLAGFFFIVGLLTYCEFVKSKKPLFYFATLFSALLGLASKPIVVVFPLVLLVLDLWLFERLEKGEAAKKILAEKIPFLALSVLFSALTFLNQGRSIRSFEQRGMIDRIADVATSYLHYIKETFWPVGLFMEDRDAFAYPTGSWALAAWILLIALTVLALRLRKSAPMVTAGWWWYLAVLFPVSGIFTFDSFFVSDHFTYLPHIGLIVSLVWGTKALYSRFAENPRPLAAFGAAIVLALSVLCFNQVSLWENDFVLFGHIDRMSGGKNPMAKNGLGIASYRSGNYREAYDYFSSALALEPKLSGANGNKGLAAEMLGNYREAAFLIERQLQFWPDHKEMNIGLARVLILADDLRGGARQALENLRRWPNDQRALEAVDYLGGEAKARALAEK